jgi:hypothetical protein
MTEHISAGEFTRWLESDREWKSQVLDELIVHGERLAALEAVKDQASAAEESAASTKKWAVVGGTVAAIINGFLLVFGGGK